jgi:hypothetical protein
LAGFGAGNKTAATNTSAGTVATTRLVIFDGEWKFIRASYFETLARIGHVSGEN